MKRSQFLKYAGVSALMPGLLGRFSVKTFANTQIASLLGASAYNDRVLVVVQMLGGNDGLNMVIPINNYANYQNARSNIAIPSGLVLGLTGNPDAALHPAMTGLQSLYGNGKLAIIQAAGYPNTSQSHFTAQDIWMNGTATAASNTGWLGRYLDKTYAQYPDEYPNFAVPHPVAIQIGSTTSLTLEADQGSMGINVTDPNAFYSLLAGTVITPAPATNAGNELTFLRQQFQNTASYSTAIRQAALNVPVQSTYPNNNLANALKIVARLIRGGLKTKVYVVDSGVTLDTHSAQTDMTDHTIGTHANSLGNISAAITAFQADCEYMGIADRVMGMTFSEFGRRVQSNANYGTDHGSAGPMFVWGNKVQGGMIGTSPIIPSGSALTANTVVPVQNDYRLIYNTLLQNWLCMPASEMPNILPTMPAGTSYATTLSLVQTTVTCSSSNPVPPASNVYITCTPSAFTTAPVVSFYTAGGPTSVQLLDGNQQLLATIIDAFYKGPDTQAAAFDHLEDLPSGNYYLRYENDTIVQTIPITKV